jgi:hypothetical protein
MISLPLYNVQTVSASAKVGVTGQQRLMGVIIGGNTGNATVQFKNAITNTGTILLTVNALADVGAEVDLSAMGGIVFGTGIYCVLAGTGAIAYVWYE